MRVFGLSKNPSDKFQLREFSIKKKFWIVEPSAFNIFPI